MMRSNHVSVRSSWGDDAAFGETHEFLHGGERLSCENLPRGTRSVSLRQFVFLVFFLTCGGPFGLEPAVNAGGAGLTLIGLIALPFVWTIPQALMTAELAAMIPENGGSLIWVFRGLGQILGVVNAINVLVAGTIDRCIYPNLFMAYFPAHISSVTSIISRPLIIIALTYVNSAGVEVVADVSAFLMVGTLAVFVIEAPFAVLKFQMNHWLVIPSTIDWGVLLSVLLWASTGWDSIGAIAGEVADPKTTLPAGIALAVMVTTMAYIFPVIFGFALMPDPTSWSSGNGFFSAAQSVAPWLGTLVIVSALLSNLGLCNAGLAANVQVACSMGQRSHNRCRVLPEWMGKVTNDGIPYNALWAQCAVMCIVVQLDLTNLIQLDMVFTCIALLLEFAAFVVLRYKESTTLRPFKVPGGWFGLWGLTMVKSSVIFFTLVSMGFSNPGALGVGILLNVGFLVFACMIQGRPDTAKHSLNLDNF
uniref:Amino acid permease/ SLC12A domain-containing protein n=1 Tax=Spongospora subterranea TaxID=70186 RepID=A0A0H5RDH6_9EUKA|eukprot:CRZ11647.1 hypothetical protein [Spongospora subterranea]